MKTLWVEDLQEPGSVEGVFLVAESDVKLTKDDNPFLVLKLQDKTGVIDALRWNVTDREMELAQPASYLQISGKANFYKDKLQITVNYIQAPASKPDPADFLPASSRSSEEMAAEMAKYVASISHPQIKKLLQMATGDTEVGRAFNQAPAALRVHHAYLSGLLEHTLSVVELGDGFAKHYPALNRDLLLAGIILHDIGKITEYDWTAAFKYSDEGNLIGHIVIGSILVNKLMDSIPDFDPKWRMLITHMIVSHHGKLEYGSPKLPAVAEAFALHYLEDLDAKLQIVSQEMGHEGSAKMTPWSKRNIFLDTAIFRGVPPLFAETSGTDNAVDTLFDEDKETQDDPFENS